jgi:hypothetical protein
MPTTTNPFTAARRELIAALARIDDPALDVFPQPGQFRDVADHVAAIAAACDEWLTKVGAEIAANASTSIDTRCFANAFTAAIDGNAGFEIERAAEAAAADALECVA